MKTTLNDVFYSSTQLYFVTECHEANWMQLMGISVDVKQHYSSCTFNNPTRQVETGHDTTITARHALQHGFDEIHKPQ